MMLLPRLLSAPIAVMGLCSCGDEEMATRRENQDTRIRELSPEIRLIEKQLAEEAPDRTSSIAMAKLEEEDAMRMIVTLQSELTGLESECEHTQKLFDDYRSLYRLQD